MVSLRGLDIDDILLLHYFGSGFTITQSARKLNLSNPAVSHRFHKMEDLIGVPIVDRTVKIRKLTPQGEKICRLVAVIVQLLTEVSEVKNDAA